MERRVRERARNDETQNLFFIYIVFHPYKDDGGVIKEQLS